MKRLEGKVAVVTEAVGGVGLATARTRAFVVRATRSYVRPRHHSLTTTLPICWFDSR